MTESDFNKRLKTLSLIALKVIIKGTDLKTKSELLLWKFYIEGKSYYEIADDLGIESSLVGKALWNAKKELQTIISNEKELIPDEVKPYIELLLQKQWQGNKQTNRLHNLGYVWTVYFCYNNYR